MGHWSRKNVTGGGSSKLIPPRRFKRITAICVALIATFAISISAYALNPTVQAVVNGAVSSVAQTLGIAPRVATTDGDRVADGSTKDTFTASLGNDTSTRSNGRVWVDKSVSTDTVDFGNAGPVENDSDFLVTYSMLAASTAVSGETQVPVDVVFVIDNSNSMDADLSQNETRLEATVDAVNTSIEQIMESNEASRVAVVLYGLEAMTLLPLDHYDPMHNGDYVSVESEYVPGGWFEASGYRTTFTGSGSHSVTMNPGERGTNTHIGVDAGFTILNNAQNTGTGANQHVPAVVILSDGAATSSGGGDWWNPSGRSGDGTETENSYALKTAMNAQYNKQLVNQHYGVDDAGSDFACKVYTIGMGIEQLNGNDYYRAQIALDPGIHLSDNNSVARTINQAWESYLENGRWDATLDGYTFEHPSSNDISTIAYNDGYYAAEKAEDVANVFDDITSSIVTARPSVPTETDQSRPTDSGYISYEDTTGAYMEIKDVKKLIWANQVFENPDEGTDDEHNTTYTFEGEIHSEVYGDQNANVIKITVRDNGDNTQTIEVDVPAAAIPLRVNTVALNENGNVTNNKNNEAMPLRVCYTVGFAEDIDPTTLEGVADDYVNANLDEQTGKVNFYSNKYSKTDSVETIGAKATFTPAATNPYYFFQENTPIYTDNQGGNQATTIDPNGTYYVPVTYYDGYNENTDYVERKGDSFDTADLIEENDVMYVRKGAERLANLDFATASKDDAPGANNTGTASTYRHPVSNADGSFTAYLGNNGRLQLDAPASLVIAKDVTAEEGLTAPNATFTFQVTSADKTGQTVSATKTLANGATESLEVAFDGQGVATVELKDGESIEIPGMSGADYSIVEQNLPAGFAVSKIEDADTVDNATHTASGTIAVGPADETVTFTNTYSVTPVTTDGLNIDLSGSKTISGRDFQAGDTFTFTIAAARLTPNAPLPTDDADGDGSPTTVTVKPNSGTLVNFEFDDIEFTKPGEYRYVVRESAGNLPGVDYDAALFRVNIIVEDNGQGQLVLADAADGNLVSDLDGNLAYHANPFIQTWDGAQQGETVSAIAFENTYSATEATQAIQGTKVLSVNNSDMKLGDGQFTFKIEPLGYNTDGSDSFDPIPGADPAQPMPADTEAKNVANGDVIFGAMTFTQDMIGNTYGYRVTEQLPQGVDEDNPTLNGMTYDTNEKIVKVTVTRSDEGGVEHVVATVTPNDAAQGATANNFTFTNSYEPSPTTIGDATNAGITVEKSFTGHAWTGDYTFKFTIADGGNTAGLGANPMPADKTIEVGAPQSGATNTGVFGSMIFKKAGIYTYKITEVKGSNKGIDYDGDAVEVKVVVTEDETTGTLSAQVNYGQDQQAAHFDNTYTAKFDDDTAVTLNGVKDLEVTDGFTYPLRGDSIDGSFFFTVTPLDGAPGAPENAVPNHDSERVADTNDWTSAIALFNNLTFTMDDMDGQAAKTFSYVVTEQAGNVAGMTYDTVAYKVDIKVTDNGEGTLSAADPVITKGTYADGTFTAADDQSGVDGIVFTNNYGDSIQDATMAPLSITKHLTGDRAIALQKDEFTFTMSVDAANPADGVALPTPATQGNNADGSVNFGNIVFSKPGTYTISVSEEIPEDATENEDGTYSLDGVTYDTHKVTTTFVVRDANGTLVAIRSTQSGSRTFTNTYNATGTTDAALAGIKTIDGRSFQNNDAFTFQVTGSRADMAADEQIPLPQNVTRTDAGEGTVSNTGTITINPTSGTSAEINFGSIEFTKPGTYTYRISEQTSTIGGINIDTTVYLVTYKVTDQNNGVLEVSGPELAIEGAEEGADAPTRLAWKNVYEDGEVTLSGATDLTVTKNFTGRDWRDDDSFTFTLAAVDEATENAIASGDIVMPEPLTVTVDGTTPNHTQSFGNIVFKADGTYTFTVTEAKGDLDNVTYDTKPHEITVVVTDDNQGNLVIDTDKTTGTSANGSDALTFTNVYTPDDEPFDPSTDAGVQVKKVLKGRTPGLRDGEFSFEMSVANRDGSELDDSKITLPNDLTATNDADGNMDFGDITFKGEGAYTVTIKETVPADDAKAPYITYDTHEFSYNIDVTYNAETGAYEVATSNVTEADATFTNIYTAPEDSKDVLTDAEDPTTSVDGQTVTVGSELTYVITWNNDAMDADGKTVAADVVVTDTIPAGMAYVDGSANPEPASFEDGKLTWNLGEREPGATGTISFKVRVTEDAVVEGTIENTAEIQLGENDPKQTTTPSVTVKSGELSISKTVVPTKGAEINEKQAFSFDIAMQDANGDELNGTYTYKIGDTEHELAFKDGAASIELTHGQTATIAGLPQGATYTVSEADLPKGYTQTAPVDGEGAAVAAEGSIDPDQPATAEFENTYAPGTVIVGGEDADASIDVRKTLSGRDWEDGDEFAFVLAPVNDAPMPADGGEKTSITAADQTASFGAIEFDAVGIYEYTVSESNAGETIDGVTYDSHIAKVTVMVSDDGTGALSAEVAYNNAVEGANESDAKVIDAAAFTNTYKAAPTDDEIPAEFSFTKVFTGHKWTDGYDFEFVLTPADDAPMPEADEAAGVTIDDSGCAHKIVSGPQEDTDAAFDFGGIVYNAAGTYEYTVTEVAGNNDGIDYASNTAEVTVVVTDKVDGHTTGKLVATATVENGTFTNDYNTGDVEIDNVVSGGGLQIVKNMTGRKIDADAFTFTVEGKDDASTAKLTDGKAVTVSTKGAKLDGNKASETVAVPTGLIFTLDDAGKTFEYEITEKNAGEKIDGVTYDSDSHTVKYEVTDDGSGMLTVNAYLDNSEEPVATYTGVKTRAAANPVVVTFNNSYDAGSTTVGGEGAEVKLEATKELANRPMNAGEFTFNVTNALDKTDPNPVVLSGTNDADGNVTFDGSIKYTMEKLNTDVENGLTTRTHDDESGADVYTYTYAVAEDQSKFDEGITAVAGSLSITVTVTDGGKGNLTADVAYPDGDLVFKNIYGNGDKGTFTSNLAGNKVLNVESGDNAPSIEGKFTFTVDVPEGAPAPEKTGAVNDANGNVDFGKIVFTMENVFGDTGDDVEVPADEGESVAESALRTKTFVYTVTESGSVDGVTNDAVATREITFTVTDNGDGTIGVVKSYGDVKPAEGMDFTFTNTYKVEETDSSLTGDGNLTLTKKLVAEDEGGYVRKLNEGEFTFELVADAGTDNEKVVAIGTNDADGNVELSAVTFAEPGTFTYTLREANNGLGGVTYDTDTYQVTAVVTDNGNGTLSVAWTVDGAADNAVTYENVYKVSPTTVGLSAAKFLTDTDGMAVDLTDGQFTFQLKDDDKVVSEAKSNADGAVSFDTLEFDAPGTYTYTISEVRGDDEDITYDDTVYTVTIVVTDDGAGNLSAKVTYQLGEDTVDAAIFNNTLIKPMDPTDPTDPEDPDNPDPYDPWIDIDKELTGRDLKADEFQFTMALKEGDSTAVSPLAITTTNDADGSVIFDKEGETGFVFSKAGEYTFTISETKGDEANVTYDETEYTVRAVVTAGENGVLSCVWQLLGADGSVVTENPSITFHNVYEEPVTPPTPVDPDPSDPSKPDTDVDKKLTGRDLVDGEFSFTITVSSDNASHVSPKSLTGTNDASGNVTFGGKGFVFDEAGDYTFIVAEVLPSDDDPDTEGVQHNGVTYDPATFTITAHVTEQNGKLVVTWENADVPMVFENEYEPEETVDITFGATKVLEGRDLAAGEFSFELRDQDGNVVATATNAADGSIVFTSPVTFTEPGEYTYTIVEVSGNVSGVTYDDAVHTAVVTVTDNGDGTLSATVTYDGSGKLPVFTNVFTPSEPGKPEKPSKPGIPQTGDFAAAVIGGTGLAAVALIATGLYLRRRNSH